MAYREDMMDDDCDIEGFPLPEINRGKIYAVDFDGYLCDECWPQIGAPHLEIIEHFKQLKAEGNYLILWTCREGALLDEAISWCESYGLSFDQHNHSNPEMVAKYYDSRKVGADYYCDDKSYWLMPALKDPTSVLIEHKGDNFFFDCLHLLNKHFFNKNGYRLVAIKTEENHHE